jgi:hypothetical protein
LNFQHPASISATQRGAEEPSVQLHPALAQRIIDALLWPGAEPERERIDAYRESLKNMTPNSAEPWRWLSTMRPKTLVSAAPIEKIITI